jgi:aspartyl-tRNA(Asn)/glutamyl-tRNA(Gln) amidotransferase subunit A
MTVSIAAMAADLAAGRACASDLTRTALAAAHAAQPGLQAFITLDDAGAQAAAQQADRRHAAGQALGPLDGVPVAVKDNLGVRGLPWTDGTRAHARRIATADSAVVARLRAAGAVILGTLNLHEGALGATTDNPFWGRCQNPLAPGFTPGGSSGGSAAAVAAGIVPATLGTDTMGSVRIPAAYCGLWGLKPTAGLIPMRGLSHLSWTLDTIGPLGTCAGDLALMLAVLAGPDPLSPDSRALPPQWSPMAPPRALAGVRLGVPAGWADVDCEPAVRGAFEGLCARAWAAGASLITVDLHPWDPGAMRRAGLLVSEAEAAHLHGPDIAADPDGFSSGYRAALDYGARATALRLAGAYHRLMLAGHAALRALDGVDAILMPTAPQRAFSHDRPAPANQADFTALANAAGLPAVAFPVPAPKPGPGAGPDSGLPCSAQLIGPAHGEGALLALASALHDAG